MLLVSRHARCNPGQTWSFDTNFTVDNTRMVDCGGLWRLDVGGGRLLTRGDASHRWSRPMPRLGPVVPCRVLACIVAVSSFHRHYIVTVRWSSVDETTHTIRFVYFSQQQVVVVVAEAVVGLAGAVGVVVEGAGVEVAGEVAGEVVEGVGAAVADLAVDVGAWRSVEG